MSQIAHQEIEKTYRFLPTLKGFHNSGAQMRAIVGPVGSGKTTAATWEVCYYLPYFMLDQHSIKQTRWLILRNTYPELIDTTQRTVFDWFDWGSYKVQQKNYKLWYPDDGPEVEILFRSCDRPQDVKKFQSLEITGYWIDESIEVAEDIKRMLKNRIGRFPRLCPVRFGIETTNPPDVEHPTYSSFKWVTPPPGPLPTREPLKNHEGFWQPPGENSANLRPGYYDDLRSDYADNPDWADMYIEGKPGVIVRGRLVYANFSHMNHVAKESLIWSKGELIRGWDNSGNCPACVILQIPTAGHVQILREFTTDKMGIVDFANYVKTQCDIDYKGAEYIEWADPAGENKFSKPRGGFTSNAQLMRDEAGIDPKPSDQSFTARIQGVDKQLGIEDGLLIDPGCTRLINGFLGGYCYPEIGTSGEFGDGPIKNKYSHPQDALQYILVKTALEDHERLFSKKELAGIFVK